MESVLFIVVLIVAIFAFDIGSRWWRESEWKRRWRQKKDED